MEETHFLTQKARAANLNPPVDLRSLDYATKYDENLVCPICRCPFVDPVVLVECDHCFCRECIRQTWTTYTPLGPRGDCPACRTPAKLGPRSATSKILVNILDDLVVACPKHDDGCNAQVKRGEVQDHVTLYCGYGFLECPADSCELPVRRKDADEGCLHHGVSCIDCHQSMLKANLEQHWRKDCPDRRVYCEQCRRPVFYRELDEHNKLSCPAISVPCPGREYGCDSRSKRADVERHAKTCALAKLAPILDAQKQRLDEHEVAQRHMSRKLEVLETGLGNVQKLLDVRAADPDSSSADESRIPFLSSHRRQRSLTDLAALSIDDESISAPAAPVRETFLDSPSTALPAVDAERQSRSRPRPSATPTSFRPEFDDPSLALPPPSANGPYTSPLHHLLSMHEGLRDELGRVSTALQELDGRHSMHVLNENLRTRDEIAYLGGQVAGVSRQVHWLTSAQLQRQQHTHSGGGPSSSAAANADYDDLSGAGAGVEAAVSAVNSAATALRGAARIVGVGTELGTMRRRTSEEGRTKL